MRRYVCVGVVIILFLSGISFVVHWTREVEMQKEDVIMIMALFPQNTDNTFHFSLTNDGILTSSYGRGRRIRLNRHNLEAGVGNNVNLRRRNFMRSIEESAEISLDEQNFQNFSDLLTESIYEISVEYPQISLGGWNIAFLYNDEFFEVSTSDALQLETFQTLFDKIVQLSQLTSLERYGWSSSILPLAD